MTQETNGTPKRKRVLFSDREETQVMAETAAKVLRYLRTKKGWSVNDLAEHAGLPFGTVQKWDAGEVTMPFPAVCLFASLFGVTLDLFRVLPPDYGQDSPPTPVRPSRETAIDLMPKSLDQMPRSLRDIARASEVSP